MGTAKKIVEINGKKFDAETGQVINSSATPQAKPPKPSSGVQGEVLDGFVRRARFRQPTQPQKLARKAQKSKTLMRPAVKKPKMEQASSSKPKIQISSHLRLSRAKNTPKSAKISRFNHAATATPKVVKKTSALPVASPHKHSPPQNKLQPTIDHFEKAIHEATSHLETYSPTKNRKTRRLGIASIAIVGLIGLGVATYQLLPVAKVKYAGSKAGFSASLPEYNPAGFGLDGNIATSSGEVTLTYGSHTDDKNYHIKQSPSSWSSQALLANFVIPTYGAGNYQIYESQGKTIYINNNSNATWVDSGVWYRLEGDATLTSDQLQRIVNSL